jgi:alpha-1,3-fucosyltransferase
LCEDYVTEKFFKVLDFDIVPVVLGGSIYSKMAPAKSYIDVQQFKDPKQLAQYLQYLDRNTTAYAEYYEWKKYFKVNWWSKIFCHLCKSLNDPTMPPKTYPNITEWWVKDSHCTSEGSFPWSMKNDSSLTNVG